MRHFLFSGCTFIAFNLFFIFGGRPFIRLLPNFFQETIDVVVVLLSTLWFYRTLQRDPELYTRESLAGRFRKQLLKMDFPLHQYFSGRDIEDLNPHEVYVLAKVLPGFTKQKRDEAYKGVLREALEEGYVNTSSSLEVLRQLRLELDVSDSEHCMVLDELGVEDPTLLDPNRQRTLENLVRISGYRKALERLMNLQRLNASTIQTVSRNFSITSAEETEILQEFDREGSVKQRSYFYLDRLRSLLYSYHGLNQPSLTSHRPIVALLLETIRRKKKILVLAILESLEQLRSEEQDEIAQALGSLSPTVLQDILDNPQSEWTRKLDSRLITFLTTSTTAAACSLTIEFSGVINILVILLGEPNPLIQSASLYLLQAIDFNLGYSRAKKEVSNDPIVQEVLSAMKDKNESVGLSDCPLLERVAYLFNSDFFHSLENETLIQLSDRAYVKSFQQEEQITEAGDTCRELLLLIEGQAEIYLKGSNQVDIISSLLPGKVLDELEVLTHTHLMGTIVAKSTPTRVLAIPVDAFDDLLERDRHLAMKVLELESIRLKGLLENQVSLP